MITPKICLIGDIVVDVTLKTSTTDIKLRMGGIIHAARCLWSLDIPFAVAYFAPNYLDEQIVEYLTSLSCQDIFKLGEVTGAPYVFLIQEVKEIGDQGYEFLLRDSIKVQYDEISLDKLYQTKYEDYFLITGNYNAESIINNLKGRIHIDVANNVENIDFFNQCKQKLDTIFISTSSGIFTKLYQDDFESFANNFKSHTQKLILKENRGGSRAIDFTNMETLHIPAQTKPIMHSVGVGDVYDCVYVGSHQNMSLYKALILSSWIATEYAVTTFPDDFKTSVTRIISDSEDLDKMGGVLLPWENRKKINIYIAAPDFDFIETLPIEKLVNALNYHNFNPRRPIKENGQMEENASKSRKVELFTQDMALLEECSILVAVLLYDDPGTLIEIGLSSAKGIPTIVYDPYKQANNCMLTELPDLVSSNLDEIISEVFIKSSILNNNE